MFVNLLAVCVIIVKLPFLILSYLAKHRALLIIAVVAIIGIAAFKTINKPKPEPLAALPIPSYQQIEPSKDKAPHVIQTVSPDRVYYVAAFTDDGRIITLTPNGYYMYNKKKWEIGILPLPLDRANYKEIRIYNR